MFSYRVRSADAGDGAKRCDQQDSDPAHRDPHLHPLPAVQDQRRRQHRHLLREDPHHLLDEQPEPPLLRAGALPLPRRVQRGHPLRQHVEPHRLQNSLCQGHSPETQGAVEFRIMNCKRGQI